LDASQRHCRDFCRVICLHILVVRVSVLTTTDPVGTVTQYSYDGSGNLISVTRDAGTGRINQRTSFAYNARGDVISVLDPKGNITSNIYDAARRLTSTAAPNGLVTAYTYDLNGQLIGTQQSLYGTMLRSTGTTYTLTGKPAIATDANGNKTTIVRSSCVVVVPRRWDQPPGQEPGGTEANKPGTPARAQSKP
jgi:YD repeat-containing protein